MSEIKILHQKARQLQTELDFQDMETLGMLESEMKVPLYLHRDEENDEPVINPDKSVSYIRTVNINGIQWQIPVEVKCEVPKTIYEMIQRTEYLKNLYKPKPHNFVKVDLGYDHLFPEINL